ncbi:MAG: ferritin-like domain-containing protein, partial [Actinomycetota bacterium]|nr:ferritin-like domain-containing protein [Actinomycetota bacterium]
MTRQEIIDRLNLLRAQELFAIQQYMNHHYRVKGQDFVDIRDLERNIALAEMRHAEALAEKINMLGGQPISNPGQVSEMKGVEIITGETTEEMLRADLNLERSAITSYAKAISDIGDTDPGIRKLLEDILIQEEDHADTFGSWLGEEQAYQ